MIRELATLALVATLAAPWPAAADDPGVVQVLAPLESESLHVGARPTFRATIDAPAGEFQIGTSCAVDEIDGPRYYSWDETIAHPGGSALYEYEMPALEFAGECAASIISADASAWDDSIFVVDPVPVSVSAPRFSPAAVYLRGRHGRREVVVGRFRLNQEAEVTAVIRRASGKFIGEVAVGELPAGPSVFRWGGRAGEYTVFVPPGRYSVTLIAKARSGIQGQSAPAAVIARLRRPFR